MKEQKTVAGFAMTGRIGSERITLVKIGNPLAGEVQELFIFGRSLFWRVDKIGKQAEK